MSDDVTQLVPIRRGHFLLDSGHHGDLWLDLELLCLRPDAVRRFAGDIAVRLGEYQIDVVCAPLVEGAFVGLMAASELGVPFTYSERFVDERPRAPYPFGYRLPGRLRAEVRAKRVAIVDDVINAGSAVRATYADLKLCGAEPVAIAALAVLGTSAMGFCAEAGVALEAITRIPNEIWMPADCPLCARSEPLTPQR